MTEKETLDALIEGDVYRVSYQHKFYKEDHNTFIGIYTGNTDFREFRLTETVYDFRRDQYVRGCAVLLLDEEILAITPTK